MDDFLAFVVERHRIWEQRQAGEPGPWTDDPVLANKKFTNVFRILDPGTQFLMTDLFEPGLSQRDTLMRAFLYRHTGRVDAWQYLDVMLGGYPVVGQLEDARAYWLEYRDGGPKKRAFFSSAYNVNPFSIEPGTDKLDSVVNFAISIFTPGAPDDIMPDWLVAETQAERFKVLNRYSGVGKFMSMQVLTDWGYQCGEDREEEFLVPGPGSVKGAKAIDPDAKTMDVVHRVVEAVRGVANSPRLGYRSPSLMDIGSNLLCEWSKYVRFRGQPVPKKTYQPAHPGKQPEPVLPSYYTEELI